MLNLNISNNDVFGKLTANMHSLVQNLPNAAVTALAGFVIIRILSWFLSWILSFIRMPRGLRGIVVSLIDTLLIIFLIIVVLQALGLNNLALVFSASIAAVGLALGNGSATLVADILAGVTLAQDRDFSVGDIVKAGESGTEGEILSMDMRRTRIRDKKGQIHSMPNAVIERKEFVLVTKKRDRKAT